MAKPTTRLLTVLSLVLFTVGCDRVTKGIAAHSLAGQPRLSLAADCIRLEYAENRGGFLGLGARLPHPVRIAVFGVGTLVVLGLLGAWLSREVVGGRGVVGPSLLWAGGAANLADRLAHGTVVDFLNVGVGTLRTGIFNVADVAISLGAALVVLDLVLAPGARRRLHR